MGFHRFLVDTEICVDRIAAMQVHDMNIILAEMRKEIMQKHNPVKMICTCVH